MERKKIVICQISLHDAEFCSASRASVSSTGMWLVGDSENNDYTGKKESLLGINGSTVRFFFFNGFPSNSWIPHCRSLDPIIFDNSRQNFFFFFLNRCRFYLCGCVYSSSELQQLRNHLYVPLLRGQVKSIQTILGGKSTFSILTAAGSIYI